MSIPEIFFSVVSVLVGIAAIVVPLWGSWRRYALRWTHVAPPKSMLDVAPEVATSLKITYKGKVVDNLTRYLFVLHNTGFAPLEKEHIVERLTWRAPGAIKAHRVEASEPRVELELEDGGQELRISWELFNQRCKALISVLCEGGASTQVCAPTAQIRHIPKIEHREFRWHDEVETLRRIWANWEAQNGKFGRILARFMWNSWMLKVGRVIVNLYAVVFYLAIPTMIATAFGAELLVIVAVDFAVAALGLLVFLKFRNPYAKLLRAARDSQLK